MMKKIILSLFCLCTIAVMQSSIPATHSLEKSIANYQKQKTTAWAHGWNEPYEVNVQFDVATGAIVDAFFKKRLIDGTFINIDYLYLDTENGGIASDGMGGYCFVGTVVSLSEGNVTFSCELAEL